MSDIPAYLLTSALIRNLDPSEPHCVSPEFCKPDATVSSQQDFEWLERTLDFWGQFKHDLFELAYHGSPFVPKAFYRYRNIDISISTIEKETDPDAILWMISRMLVMNLQSWDEPLVLLPDNAVKLLTTSGLNEDKLIRLLEFTSDFARRHDLRILKNIMCKNMAELVARCGCLQKLQLLQLLLSDDKAKNESWQLSQLLEEINNCFSNTNGVIASAVITGAARGGHLVCLRYMHEHGCPWDARTASAAAYGGHLDCLKYLHENDCPWGEEASCAAASEGNVNCLRYLHQHGCPWNEETAAAAALKGHLDCLQYMYENLCHHWNENVSRAAAAGGHLNCLRYLHENGCPWDRDTTKIAAEEGHLSCLRYLHDNGCPWSDEATKVAAAGGYLECLLYLHESGCRWDKDAVNKAAEGGHLSCLKYLYDNGCRWNSEVTRAAAKGGHLDCLQYLHDNGCPWNVEVVKVAAAGGHLDCLRYLHENGCSWNVEVTYTAAKRGHLNCLRYLHENGCPWSIAVSAAACRSYLDYFQETHMHFIGSRIRNVCGGRDKLVPKEVTTSAADRWSCTQYLYEHGCPYDDELTTAVCFHHQGYLDFLQHVHENGYALNEWTMSAAAACGHVDCIRHLRAQGCPWDEWATKAAAAEGHLICLRYLHDNGCPWDNDIAATAAAGGHVACVEYLHSQGVP